jgi:hypothetical protein
MSSTWITQSASSLYFVQICSGSNKEQPCGLVCLDLFYNKLQSHFLLRAEDVGKREFSGKLRTATHLAGTDLLHKNTIRFTEITVTHDIAD